MSSILVKGFLGHGEDGGNDRREGVPRIIAHNQNRPDSRLDMTTGDMGQICHPDLQVL